MNYEAKFFGVVCLTSAIVSAAVAIVVVDVRLGRVEPVVELPKNPHFEHVNARSIHAQFVTVGPVEPLGQSAGVRIHGGERFAFIDVYDADGNRASVSVDKHGPRLLFVDRNEVKKLP